MGIGVFYNSPGSKKLGSARNLFCPNDRDRNRSYFGVKFGDFCLQLLLHLQITAIDVQTITKPVNCPLFAQVLQSARRGSLLRRGV